MEQKKRHIGRFTDKYGSNNGSNGIILKGGVKKEQNRGGDWGSGEGVGSVLGSIFDTLLNPQTISAILNILALKYNVKEMKKIKEELYDYMEKHSNSEQESQERQDAKLQKMKQEILSKQEESDRKLQNRLDILYPTMRDEQKEGFTGGAAPLQGSVEMQYNPNYEPKEEHDIYTQDLIKEIRNTVIEVEGIGKVKAETLIPNLEKYIEDNRTKEDKRADILYPTMKKDNPIVADIKLAGKVFPYFVDRLNIELEARGKEKVTGVEVMDSFEWETDVRNILESAKQYKKILNNREAYNSAINVEKFLKYMEVDKNNPTTEELKRQEDLKEMINDYINGGNLSKWLASKKFRMPDAAELLRLNGKDSNLNIDYTRKADKYNSAYELPEKLRDITISKLESQGLSTDTKGLYFNSDSELSKRIALTPQIIDKIKEKQKEIKLFCDYNSPVEAGVLYPKISVEYKPNQNRNMYYAFHNADIHNLKYDMFGNISGDLIDTTDYNKGKNEPILVQKARELQEEGKIEPKFVIVHFVIPKEIFRREILKK